MSQRLRKVDWTKLNPELQEKLKDAQAKFIIYDDVVKKVSNKETRYKIFQCQKKYMYLKELVNTLNQKISQGISQSSKEELEKIIDKTYSSLTEDVKRIKELTEEIIYLSEEEQAKHFQEVKEQEEKVFALIEYIKRIIPNQPDAFSPLTPNEVLENLQKIKIVIEKYQQEIEKKYLSKETKMKYVECLAQLFQYEMIMNSKVSVPEDIEKYRPMEESQEQLCQKDRIVVFPNASVINKERIRKEEKEQLNPKEQRETLKWLKKEIKITQTRIETLNAFLIEPTNQRHHLKAKKALQLEKESLKVIHLYQKEVKNGYEMAKTKEVYAKSVLQSDKANTWLNTINSVKKDIQLYEEILKKIEKCLQSSKPYFKRELIPLRSRILTRIGWAKNIWNDQDERYEEYDKDKQKMLAKIEEVFPNFLKRGIEKAYEPRKEDQVQSLSKIRNRSTMDYFKTDEKGYITSDSYLAFTKEQNQKGQQRTIVLKNSNQNGNFLKRIKKNDRRRKWLRKSKIAIALAATITVGSIGSRFGWIPKRTEKSKETAVMFLSTDVPMPKETVPISKKDATIKKSTYHTLETYKEKLKELQAQLSEKENQYQTEYEIDGYGVKDKETLIAPDYIKDRKKESLKKSIAMVNCINPNDIITATSQEEIAIFEEMGYIPQAVSVLNQYPLDFSNVEGHLNNEEKKALTLH